MYRYLIAVCSFFSTKSSKHSIQRNKQEMSWLVKTLITSNKVKRISAIGNLRRIRREYLIWMWMRWMIRVSVFVCCHSFLFLFHLISLIPITEPPALFLRHIFCLSDGNIYPVKWLLHFIDGIRWRKKCCNSNKKLYGGMPYNPVHEMEFQLNHIH